MSEDDLTPLVNVSQLFSSRLAFEENMNLLAMQVASRLEGDCLFLLLEPGQGRLVLRGRARWPNMTGGEADFEGLEQHLWALEVEETAGAPWHAARLGTSTFAPCLATFPEPLDPIFDRLGAVALIAVPIRAGQEWLGLIVAIRRRASAPFAAEHLAAIQALAPQTAGALVNATLLAEERWQRQKAELMFQASRAIHTELHFEQAVREIALLLKQSIKAPWVGLLEYQPDRQVLRLLGSTFEPDVDLRLATRPWHLHGWPDAMRILAEPDHLTPITLPPAIGALIGQVEPASWGLPLMHKKSPQGLLLLTCPPKQPLFRPEAQEVAVAIAEFMALALANHHLIEEEARARIQIIRSQTAAQEREVLLRQIVHDLRNATQAMSLVVEDMELAANASPELHASLAILDNQITFVSNFLKEKLNWMQMGARPGTGDVATLETVFADLEQRYGPAARAKRQRLIVSPPDAIEVALSSVQLEQIVGNLLDNAIKYTPDHGEVRMRADFSDGWVTIYVSDTGPGIPADMHAHLGELGYRGQHDGVEGSGVGLANVRQLVTRAGGLIGLSSNAFGSPYDVTGTTFHVSLPTTLWGKIIL